MIAIACGAIVIKCSLTINSRCCTLSVTSVYAKPSRVNLDSAPVAACVVDRGTCRKKQSHLSFQVVAHY